jgi:hypothetical protein
VDGRLDREAGCAQAPEHGIVKSKVRRAVVGAPFHVADRPAVAVERLAGRDGPLA